MIVDLPDTTTSQISKTLVKIREEGGAVALGRVLTLIISTKLGEEEEAIEAANDASREHPMRVIVVSTSGDHNNHSDARLDAQIRVGGDAGASEVIVRARLRRHRERQGGPGHRPPAARRAGRRLVAGRRPAQRVAVGARADRSAADHGCRRGIATRSAALDHIAKTYAPGDTDFAWTRLTLWRAQLAAVLDQPPYETITGVEVDGAVDSPSTVLLAAWLQEQLQVEVELDDVQPRRPGRAGSTGFACTAHPEPSSSSARFRTSRRSSNPGNRRTTSRCPGAAFGTASPRNCDGSTRTGCSARSSATASRSSRRPRDIGQARSRPKGKAAAK